MTNIVVIGLIGVVILVVVLVVLGMRARDAGDQDDDWTSDEQPRGRRGGYQEDRAADDYGQNYDQDYDAGYDQAADQSYDSGYDQNYDRPVAGGGAAPAPKAPPAAAPRPAPANDEMADDDYWATITFDKPKFPWQHDKADQHDDAELVGDPLGAPVVDEAEPLDEPATRQPAMLDERRPGTGPQSIPAPPPAFSPGSAGPVGSDPLDHQPGSFRTDPSPEADPLTGPAPIAASFGTNSPMPYGDPPGYNETPTYNDGPGYNEGPSYGESPSYGDAPAYNESPSYNDAPAYNEGPSYSDAPGYGDAPAYGANGPLSSGEQFTPGQFGDPAGPTRQDPLDLPVSAEYGRSAPVAGGPGDTDGHRLPTVDELLQRIQTDRERSAPPAGGTPGGGAWPPVHDAPSDGRSSGYGDPLNDPLSDPLGVGEPSYGSAPSWNPGQAGSGQGYEPEPQMPATQSPGMGSFGGFPSSPPGQGPGGAGSGGGYQTDGYPSQPAYADPPRYDDPMPGYDPGPGGRDTFGSFGAGEPSGGQPAQGGFGDYPNYGEGPANPDGGYGQPGPGPHDPGGYTPGYPGGGPPQPGYGPEAGQPYGPGTGQNHPGDHERQQDDWENHRDYRR